MKLRDSESRWYSTGCQVEMLEGAMDSTAGLGLATHHILGALIEALMEHPVCCRDAGLKVAGQMVIDGTDTPERNEAARVIGGLIKAFAPEGH